VTIWAAVFARGGSVGLPGKNLKILGGIPLVAHSIRVGKQITGIGEILCSTDSPDIAAVATDCGAKVPFMRPCDLADDRSPEWDSWRHMAVHLLENGGANDDIFVSLPAVAPLRHISDVEAAIERFRSSGADVVVSYTEARRSPWFNMVEENSDGFLTLVMNSAKGAANRRQDGPRVFDLATVVYVTTLGFIVEAEGIFSGRVAGVEIPPERAIDIDTQLDFDIAEFLFEREKGGD
jgi:N-acylneuraminate cytidylyltransferase